MASKYKKNRPTISSEIKREIAIESGHSCAIKGCSEHTYNEYHHIDFNRENNNPKNLIYLCDKHHKMAHKGIIDKKSLREYKKQNSNITGVSIKDEPDNECKESKIHIDDIRPIDVLEDKFIPNSKEMGIKLYEVWAEYQHKYTQEDFSRLLNIPENKIYEYFTGKVPLNLQQILMITEIFNLSKSYFFEATYWTRKAYWKEDVVKYSILSIVHPKSKISNIVNEGIFYSSILKRYAEKICKLHNQLFKDNDGKNEIFFQKNINISSELREQIGRQYYKVLEQYPEFDKTRSLLNYEKILRNWFFTNGEYISRILIEGIKNIDITDINNPVVTCRFEEDIKNEKVISQIYNENTLTMENA